MSVEQEKQENMTISDNEKEALMEAILARQEDRAAKKQPLPEELQDVIRRGANSEDVEIRQLCALLTYEAIEAYYAKKARGYVEKGRTDFEDLASELYILIAQHLHRYNGKNSLFTFFDPLVSRAFMKAREQGRGLNSTRYFRDLGPSITRAQDELKKLGLEDPTPTDISDYIRVKRKKVIAEATIEQWILAHKTDTSINEIGDIFEDQNENNDPVGSLIKQEENAEFYDAIKKTSFKSQEILLLEVAYIERRGLIPTVKELYPMMLERYPTIRLQEVELLVSNAHSELKAVLSGRKRKLRRLPLNHVKTKVNYPKLFEDDDEDIAAAMEESMDSILPTDEDDF